MTAVVLACLIELLGHERFRVRESVSVILLRGADSPRTRLALSRAGRHADPEIRRRSATVLETWASVWPTGGGPYPRVEYLLTQGKSSWLTELLAEAAHQDRRVMSAYHAFAPMTWAYAEHCKDAGRRALSVTAVRHLLDRGAARSDVVELLDEAISRERRDEVRPIFPPAGGR